MSTRTAAVSVTAQSSPVLPPPVDRRRRRRSDPAVNPLSPATEAVEPGGGRAPLGGQELAAGLTSCQGLMPDCSVDPQDSSVVWQSVSSAGARLVLPRSGICTRRYSCPISHIHSLTHSLTHSFIQHIVDQQSIMFYRRLLQSSDVILSTLLRCKQSDIHALNIASRHRQSLITCSETIYGTAMSVK